MSFFGVLLSIVLITLFGSLSVKLIIGFIRDIKNRDKVVLENKVENVAGRFNIQKSKLHMVAIRRLLIGVYNVLLNMPEE